MKNYILYVLLFFALLFGIDRICGMVFPYMSEHSKGGFTGHVQYLMKKTNEDVLVFGSSRAIHHYNPQIISDSLKLSCYNCGQNGEGIIFFYGVWKEISKRYHPKIVLYDVFSPFDLLIGEDNHKYLGWLKDFYDDDAIAHIFEDVDVTEKYKMQCQMYRYNSKFHQIIGDYIHPVKDVQANGFKPLYGEVDTMRINKRYNPYGSYKFDSLKIAYLNKLANEMGETKLYFVVSPSWYGFNEKQLEPVLDICKKDNVSLINLSNEKQFLRNDSLFKDGEHLNSVGADHFTSLLIKSLIYE